MARWSETIHCTSCDGIGKRYYTPNNDYKKTCLACSGKGIEIVWVTTEMVEQRRKAEAEVERLRHVERTAQVERARQDKRKNEQEQFNRSLIQLFVAILVIGLVIALVLHFLPAIVWVLKILATLLFMGLIVSIFAK